MALVFFAKAPVPGEVKTRLCPPLTHDEAATLHGSLVLDALERSRPGGGGKTKNAKPEPDRWLACSPTMNHPFFQIMEERQGVRLIEQHGEDLGVRMAQAFSSLFAQGYQQVVLVGTDLPVLPATHCTQAFSLLNTHDLVLGPSTDGGYYLIGLRRPVPDLFVGIPWSTEHVFEKTQALATHLGLQMSLLPQVRDLDTADDLLAVIEDTGLLQSKNCPPSLTNRTASVLRMLHERLTAWPEESE